MGSYNVTLQEYKDKRFVQFDYVDTDEAKAKFRTFNISVAKLKSILKRVDLLNVLLDLDCD
jgi:hypothetical protein